MVELGVVEQILSMLPPKSLMRFKCVSKSWYSHIISPRFIAKHLSKSMHRKLPNTSTLLVRHIDETEAAVFSLLNFHNDGADDHSSLATLIPRGEAVCKIISHCNGIICLAKSDSREVFLWNPAIKELKLLPTLPHVPDPPDEGLFQLGLFKQFMVEGLSPEQALFQYWVEAALGFGYDPSSNDYKLVNLCTPFPPCPYIQESDGRACIDICIRPMSSVYNLRTDSWREAKSHCLETETTLLQPLQFQMCFKGLCYWIGIETLKEIDCLDTSEEENNREVMVMFDVGSELFDALVLPGFCLQSLLVWNNESIACSCTVNVPFGASVLEIWMMDDFGPSWTKHFTLEAMDKPLAYFMSDEILMLDSVKGCLFSYNLGTKSRKYFPIQRVARDYSPAFVYADSIVPLLGCKTAETSTCSVKYPQISHSMPDDKWYSYSYSIWAIPPNDVSLRIKNVMDGLRAEFGGPEIEPHIPFVGAIRMTLEQVLSKFTSLQSKTIHSFEAKVEKVVTRNFYYHCVSLLIDSTTDLSFKLQDAARICGHHFGFYFAHRPRLSLLCGNLTEEERKRAHEKVSIMDESITSLSFPVTRLALYKINCQDTTLKSWVKIAECPLLLN